VACEKLFVRVERETDMLVAVSFVLNVERVLGIVDDGALH
jgi:hypothetical protein